MRVQAPGVNISIDTVSYERAGRLARYLKKPLLAATAVAVFDVLVLFIAVGAIPRTTFVLILFLEGGIGLVVGVIIALSSSPSITKLGELTMGAAPWSRDSEKHAEQVGSRWIMASVILVAVGFIVSAI